MRAVSLDRFCCPPARLMGVGAALLIVAFLVVLAGTPSRLAAQGKKTAEFTPFVGVYVPTTKSIDESSGSEFLRSKEKTTVIFGGRVGVWVTERVGVEGSWGYAPSKVKTEFNLTGFGSDTVEENGNVMMINARLLLGFGPQTGNASWHLIVGGGVITHGGDAWSGVDGTTDFGGVAGIGGRFKVGPMMSLRVDVEDNLYSAKFGVSGAETNSKFQNDLGIAMGLSISFGQ